MCYPTVQDSLFTTPSFFRSFSYKSAVPNLFGTRDQFQGRQFFHGLCGGIVSGWFKSITSIVQFISIIVIPAPLQINRSQRLGTNRSQRLGTPGLNKFGDFKKDAQKLGEDTKHKNATVLPFSSQKAPNPVPVIFYWPLFPSSLPALGCQSWEFIQLCSCRPPDSVFFLVTQFLLGRRQKPARGWE